VSDWPAAQPEQIALEPGRIADRSVRVIDTAAREAELELQPVVQQASIGIESRRHATEG